MKTITLDIDKVLGAITRKQIDALTPKITQSMDYIAHISDAKTVHQYILCTSPRPAASSPSPSN